MDKVIASDEQLLRNFILENYLFTNDQSKLENADSFLGSGILDSMGILELVYFLDDEMSIKVESSEMVPKNLDSIDNLLKFIDLKKNLIPGL